MKKYVLLTVGCALAAGAFSMPREAVAPVLIENVLSTNITPDGKWIGNYGGSASLYNTQTDELTYFTECILGLGNPIASDGTAVGYRSAVAVIMKNGRGSTPEPLRVYSESSINAITPDGSRIAGYLANPDVDIVNGSYEMAFIPFYCDIDEDGTVGTVNILPYPEKDFWGNRPTYVTAVWISEDGKTILGQMNDSFGRMNDPVVFREGSDGEWSCLTPSKDLFNPLGIVLPPDPWVDFPPVPNPEDFMSPLSREVYMELYEEWVNGYGDEPDPYQFMSQEEEDAYREAYQECLDYYNEHLADFKHYDEVYLEILNSSPVFGLNQLALKYDGTQLATAANIDDENGDTSLNVYVFDIEQGTYKKIQDSNVSNIYPTQILSDGTIVAASGMMDVSKTYLLLPGTEKFINFEDYMKSTNPGIYEWMDETIPYGSGLVAVSDDISIFAGGLIEGHFAKWEYGIDVTWITYIYKGANGSAGIDHLQDTSSEEFFRVYNLQGVKVMETGDKADLQTLGKGLYIVNGKKVMF